MKPLMQNTDKDNFSSSPSEGPYQRYRVNLGQRPQEKAVDKPCIKPQDYRFSSLYQAVRLGWQNPRPLQLGLSPYYWDQHHSNVTHCLSFQHHSPPQGQAGDLPAPAAY